MICLIITQLLICSLLHKIIFFCEYFIVTIGRIYARMLHSLFLWRVTHSYYGVATLTKLQRYAISIAEAKIIHGNANL